jgi:hypothetical protein
MDLADEQRWKTERLFAWPGNVPLLVARCGRRALNECGFVWLGCLHIALRWGMCLERRR